MSKTWKKVELEIASILARQIKRPDIRRNPITGRQRGDVADIEHPIVSVEVKHRKSLPYWLFVDLPLKYNFVQFDEFPTVMFQLKHGLPKFNKLKSQEITLYKDKSLPKWLENAVKQATAARRDYHKACLIVMHQKKWKYEDSWCMLFDFNEKNT